jgi:acid phosphatase type 7
VPLALVGRLLRDDQRNPVAGEGSPKDGAPVVRVSEHELPFPDAFQEVVLGHPAVVRVCGGEGGLRDHPGPAHPQVPLQAVEDAAGHGYYSYDVGSWHVVALNSNCEEVRCGPGSPQTRWLEEDLAAADQVRCTLAYMHHPRFSSGEKHGSTSGGVEVLWEALYEANTDVVLSGHEHNYERFAPQDPRGRADPERGIRQFVVGTGGGGGEAPISSDPITNSEVRTDGIDGVLELTLRPQGYEWEFIPVGDESFTDSGDGQCH